MKPTALITGASSGLGYEFARLFAANGYNLIVTARNEVKLQELQNELEHVDVTIVPKDLSQPHSAEELYKELDSKDIHVNVLVNNAGFGLTGSFDKLSLQEQQDMMQVNMTTLTDLTYWFLPEMKKLANKGEPAGILNVASTAAFQPGPGMSIYYASKAYVLSFSEGLAGELKGTGVNITTLCPGATETNFFKTARGEKMKLAASAMSASVVAKAGFEGFQKGQRIIIPGRSNAVGAVLAKFLPSSITAKIAKNLNSTDS
ncbi:SDR family NAD(P)-dependent oxidoreductase [Pontibacillus yanchengensis]|uniref:SDR family NAD(P)-dependent oxidoreductase n=1 Tax=Pontibacillus yanchengensis TaxID=462910 RepID=A0A6I5A4H1_9BACI|nr:SDR family oxidoreductase [Pontibacillus yanchengensis]MYL35216.1 SDR family NAD(P)-dependent oxidoreductase [Pontibacillus yanchengensis]